MQNVKPCPYCGGEVEVIKLIRKKNEKTQPYRIECLRCRRLVARGQGFPIESYTDAQQRLKEYDEYIQETWYPNRCNRIEQSDDAVRRDYEMAVASRISEEDELFDEVYGDADESEETVTEEYV